MMPRAAQPHEFPWLVERVGCHLTSDAKGVCVVDGKGRIRAMALADWWTGSMAMAHLAVDTPIAMRALAAAFFPWFFAHREILMGMVRASNKRALRVDLHLGFREVHRIRGGAAPGEDLIQLEMRRADCRWLAPTTREKIGVLQVVPGTHRDASSSRTPGPCQDDMHATRVEQVR